MTKAERIYYATRYECKKHIEYWGYQTNPDGSSIGYNSLICDDDESICTRTLNAVEKVLRKKRLMEEQFYKCGIHDLNKFNDEMQIMNMIKTTILNNRESLKKMYEV